MGADRAVVAEFEGQAGCRWRNHREVIEAIAWRYRTRAPWRDLPLSFGPWQTAWKRLNSSNVRAHQHSAGARAVAPSDTGGGGLPARFTSSSTGGALALVHREGT